LIGPTLRERIVLAGQHAASGCEDWGRASVSTAAERGREVQSEPTLQQQLLALIARNVEAPLVCGLNFDHKKQSEGSVCMQSITNPQNSKL